MNQLEFNKKQLQMDYFSESYRQFEADFYRYSAISISLTFITDDILLSMAKTHNCYFKLNRQNAKDGQDHYYLFTIKTINDNQKIENYIYHRLYLS